MSVDTVGKTGLWYDERLKQLSHQSGKLPSRGRVRKTSSPTPLAMNFPVSRVSSIGTPGDGFKENIGLDSLTAISVATALTLSPRCIAFI